MIALYKLAAKDFFSDMKLAWQMLKRGKLKFWPSNIEDKAEVRKMFDQVRKG